MMFGFLFWIFLIGIIVASLQDLRRREVDNWLNLFLLLCSLSFIFFKAIFEKDSSIIFHAGFFLVLTFLIMNLFYYGRVFAGGDAKLLFALSVFFLGSTFWFSLINVGIFLLFLMFAGSIYGLFYSSILYFQNFKKVNSHLRKGFDVLWVKLCILFGSFLLVGGFFSLTFIVFGILIFLFPLLYVFAKSLENVVMVRIVSGKDLREGDWLVEDVKIGKKLIRANWEGLSKEDLKILFSKKKVKIREGLPFVPAFLIAFFTYVFLKGWFINFLFGLS